jgi:aspartyl/asparaginyl beta-hydroxylase (cupin superfamily)
MFEDSARFSFAAELERNWSVIRDEMVALRSTGFIAWPEKSLYGEDGWSTFGLYAFGQKQSANCALCPRTTALVESIPGLTPAGFSRLAPGAHIKPHVGYDEYSRYVLRLHLALETNAHCALRVADETRSWEEGRSLVFCDAVEHEAWNRGTTTRTVLLLDFKNPRYRFRILNPSFSPEFVEFVETVRWPEMRFFDRMQWRLWKLAHFGRTPPPAGQSAHATRQGSPSPLSRSP